MSLGDSKTTAAWIAPLVAGFAASTTVPWAKYYWAGSGQTVASSLAAMDGILAAFPNDTTTGDYLAVTLNWGVNYDDQVATQAVWEANYLSIIDKIHTKAPRAKVYIARPWMVGYDARAAVLHGWIDNIVAARAFAYVGPDEAVWLKGADNGATMTVDGVHYSTAGAAEAANQWQAVLGY